MKNHIILALLMFFVSCKNEKQAEMVNPFIGTGGYVQANPGDSISYDSIRNKPAVFPFGGLTFPGAVVPFGMIQLSPDCNTNGFGWSAGHHTGFQSYAYKRKRFGIRALSFHAREW
jgi:putative alpha-1,2-mannosidase